MSFRTASGHFERLLVILNEVKNLSQKTIHKVRQTKIAKFVVFPNFYAQFYNRLQRLILTSMETED